MNKEIMIIKNVRGYQDKNGVAQLNLEDVSRGLGFTFIATSGNEVIRWNRVRNYLQEFKFDTSAEKDKLPEYIPENIFYKLCFKAKNEVARKFQDVVTDEVLPSIRKTGGYIAGEKNMTEDELILKAMNVLQIKVENYRLENQKLLADNNKKEQLIGELQPKADYTDRILQCDDLTKVNIIACDYGFSAVEFNKLLNKFGIQYKQGKDWLLYSNYRGQGYTQTKTFDFKHKDGTKGSKPTMMWTQKGRLFLYNFLKEKGIYPRIEEKGVV